jgi:hypothetical protein
VELGAGCGFWKLERKTEQTTHSSGVGCGAWSGGFQKSWQNSVGSCGDESIGLHGLHRGFVPVFLDDLRSEVAEGLVGPPGVVAVEPAFPFTICWIVLMPFSASSATRALNSGSCLLRLAFILGCWVRSLLATPNHHNHSLAPGPNFGVHLTPSRFAVAGRAT